MSYFGFPTDWAVPKCKPPYVHATGKAVTVPSKVTEVRIKISQS